MRKIIGIPENPVIELREQTPVNIGDSVQWLNQGSEMFDEPKKVTGISEDEKFIFVEGTNTGLPIEQVYIVKRK